MEAEYDLNKGTAYEGSPQRGCIFLNETTDRFMLSWDVYNRYKMEMVFPHGDTLRDDAIHEDMNIDVCAYQMILDKKAEILGEGSLEEPYEVPRHCMSSKIPDSVL